MEQEPLAFETQNAVNAGRHKLVGQWFQLDATFEKTEQWIQFLYHSVNGYVFSESLPEILWQISLEKVRIAIDSRWLDA